MRQGGGAAVQAVRSALSTNTTRRAFAAPSAFFAPTPFTPLRPAGHSLEYAMGRKGSRNLVPPPMLPRHVCAAAAAAALFVVPTLAQVRDPAAAVASPIAGANAADLANREALAGSAGLGRSEATRRMAAIGEVALRNPSAAVVAQDGELWGCGDAYKVRFDAAAIEFVPALPAAPHNQPLRYELLAVGRGEDLVPVPAGERRRGDRVVEYSRGAVAERYDVRPEGVEQSYVFERVPAGAGDLVVRGRVATALQVTPHHGGLRCELPGVGGFTIGGVTGIDADGNRVAGSMHYADGVLDYRLPAAFVAAAKLPLVLDPLLGGVFNVAVSTTTDDGDPDAAYDATNDVFLVVFERVFSATDHDIHCQRVDAAGALVGSRIFLDNSASTYDYAPAVANSNSADRFAVSWTRFASPNYDIRANSVNAADGTFPAAQLLVAGSADIEYYVDLSGEATTADDDVIAVWSNLATDSVMAAQLGFNADGSLFVWDTTAIITDTGSRPLYPRIDRSGGDTGNHMIVWSREYTASTDYDPQGALVSRELTTLDAIVAIDAAINFTQFPEVDGDGRTWLVAWHVREAAGTDNDIAVRSFCLNSTVGSGVAAAPITLIEDDAGDNENNVAVCWTGESWLVAFRDEVIGTSNYEITIKSLDPFTCASCEGEFFPFGVTETVVAMASQRSGGSTGDTVLVTAETVDTATSTSDVIARLWSSQDGRASNVGGGCGADAGGAYATCAVAGNAGFAARLVDALPSTSALLVVSRTARSIPCGTCRLIPDPYTGFVVTTSTDGNGRAAFASALPASAALVSLSVYAQWIVVEPVSPGCYLFGSDLSDALGVVIQ
jgi:hypothetical protein